MSFYITDIHPKDAKAWRKEMFIGKRIELVGELDEGLAPEYFFTGYAEAAVNVTGGKHCFAGVKLTWEDY